MGRSSIADATPGWKSAATRGSAAIEAATGGGVAAAAGADAASAAGVPGGPSATPAATAAASGVASAATAAPDVSPSGAGAARPATGPAAIGATMAPTGAAAAAATDAAPAVVASVPTAAGGSTRSPRPARRGTASGCLRAVHPEQDAVVGSHEQDRRAPFERAAHLDRQRLSGLGNGDVDRRTIRDRFIESATEFLRRVVGDLVLHRDDGRRPAADERRRRAREQVVRAPTSPLARVRARPAEADCGRRAVDRAASLGPAPRTRLRRPAPRPLRRSSGRSRHDRRSGRCATSHDGARPVARAASPDQASGVSTRPLAWSAAVASCDARPLTLDVERRQPDRAGHHAEDPERSGDGERLERLGDFDVSNQRRIRGQDEVIGLSLVVEELPRQRREGGRVEPAA